MAVSKNDIQNIVAFTTLVHPFAVVAPNLMLDSPALSSILTLVSGDNNYDYCSFKVHAVYYCRDDASREALADIFIESGIEWLYPEI